MWKKEQALRDAAGRGDEGRVKQLLAEGVNVNAADIFNDTPLHAAAKRGHPECVRVLLRAGANTVIRNSRTKKTAEELAVQEHVQQVFQVFKVSPKYIHYW
ncbi:ankyrin repeat domain-containing protein 42-like [Branchiostoma floridae x Branchiostoma belcheri]